MILNTHEWHIKVLANENLYMQSLLTQSSAHHAHDELPKEVAQIRALLTNIELDSGHNMASLNVMTSMWKTYCTQANVSSMADHFCFSPKSQLTQWDFFFIIIIIWLIDGYSALSLTCMQKLRLHFSLTSVRILTNVEKMAFYAPPPPGFACFPLTQRGEIALKIVFTYIKKGGWTLAIGAQPILVSHGENIPWKQLALRFKAQLLGSWFHWFQWNFT